MPIGYHPLAATGFLDLDEREKMPFLWRTKGLPVSQSRWKGGGAWPPEMIPCAPSPEGVMAYELAEAM